MSGFWLGIIGVVVGGLVTVCTQWIQHRWHNAEVRKRDEKRKSLLRTMLENPGRDGWRKMTTMSGVIGANRDETARLLIEIDARSSETGNDVWAFLEDKPLPTNNR